MDEKRSCYKCAAEQVCRYWYAVRKAALLMRWRPEISAPIDDLAAPLATACAAWTPVKEEK